MIEKIWECGKSHNKNQIYNLLVIRRKTISLHQISLLSSFLSSFVLSFINKVCNITNRDIFIRFAHRRSYFVRYLISSFDFVIFRRRGGSRCEYTGFFFLCRKNVKALELCFAYVVNRVPFS